MFSWIYNLIYSSKDTEIANLQNKLSESELKIKALEEGLALYVQGTNPESPKSYGVITYQEEIKLLSQFNCPINITDQFLQLTSVEEAKIYVESAKLQYRKWIKEDYDCDNFSASLFGYWSDSLKSFAFGMARSSSHQFNIFIDKDKKVWIVEPQTAKFMTPEEAQKASSPDGLNYLPLRYIWM